MEQQVPKPKWEAKLSRRLANTSADQIWPLFEDFFGVYKYFPGLSKCYGIHGRNGEVGSIRYCEGISFSTQDYGKENSETTPLWAKEKLIAIDPAERSLSYEVVDSNVGFSSYVASMKIIANPVLQGEGDDNGEGGCVVEWSFSVEPVEGWNLEDMIKQFEVWLQLMVQKMEDALHKS